MEYMYFFPIPPAKYNNNNKNPAYYIQNKHKTTWKDEGKTEELGT